MRVHWGLYCGGLIGAALLFTIRPSFLAAWSLGLFFVLLLTVSGSLVNLPRTQWTSGYFMVFLGTLMLSAAVVSGGGANSIWLPVLIMVTGMLAAGVSLWETPQFDRIYAWFVVVVIGLMVAYFSGSAGGAAPMLGFLTRVLGIDPQIAGLITIILRKLLHVCFYGIFALAAARAAKLSGVEIRQAALFGIGWALAHAIFDELRQVTEVERTGQWTDVSLDLAGMIVFLWPKWLGPRRPATA